ncbi:hypothetical protein Plec18170_008982, partial [Paecilomyces lecythidis]
MTGIEAVGIVLGILPLIINQLDNYVQGVETVRLFQHRRYRRFIERNASILAGEHAILLNTIETLLKHVTSDAELRELVANPSGRGWASESLGDKIKGQLGRDYQPFMGVLNETLATLQELSKRLGVDTLNKTL